MPTFFYHAKEFFGRIRLPQRGKLLFGAGAFMVFLLLAAFVMAPPRGFPVDSYVHIEEGTSVGAAGTLLRERGIIRSRNVFVASVRLFGGRVSAGEYYFPRRQDGFWVGKRLAQGEYEITAVRVTLHEGLSAREMAATLGQLVPDFNAGGFVLLAERDEGRLFPDTYFIFPGERPAVVHKMLRDNFDKKIADEEVQAAIKAFGRPLGEVLTMASILEKEASRMEDKRKIAGVLWKRIEIGMPLQVDAVFPYILGKNTFQLTSEDLQHDSPYNTYANKGLPPGPIGNAGLASILAAVTPIKSEYLYFLSDRQGTFHFSTTHDQHVRLKAQYVGS